MMDNSFWIVMLLLVMLVGSLIYRIIETERQFRKAHNKNKKKKFWI